MIKKEVAERTGLSIRTIQYYTEVGLIIPGIDNPKGRGTTRRYSEQNIKEFKIIKRLSSAGLSLSEIKLYMDKGRNDTELLMSNVFKIVTTIQLIKTGACWDER